MWLFRALLVLLLAGCAHQITGYPEQPRMTAGIDRSIADVKLFVHWARDIDEVARGCGILPGFVTYGCARTFVFEGQLYCALVVVAPSTFNDAAVLAVLGHEVAHCFGAAHVAAPFRPQNPQKFGSYRR